jgi:hypothetical protein
MYSTKLPHQLKPSQAGMVLCKDIFSQTKSDKIKFADDGIIWITGKEPTSLET